MRPSARIAALAELIGQIEESLSHNGLPADVLVNQYFRARRYAGSRDRREISSFYYSYLRNREVVLWALHEVGAEITDRSLLIGFLSLFKAEHLDAFTAIDDPYGPKAFSEDEQALSFSIAQLDCSSVAWSIKSNVPEWAVKSFETRFENEVEQEASALNESAAFDIRINPIKAKINLINNIKKIIEAIDKNKYSENSYRVSGTINLNQLPAYKSGEIEVQDEAAQIASMLVDAKPGMTIADLCAGAGGKSLAISAQMKNSGKIHAFDISKKRLKACSERAARGGHTNIQSHHVTEKPDDRTAAFGSIGKSCDRVVVDVPCSGSGTWRRSPDQRWRMNGERLYSLNKIQLDLLQEASGLVKAEGRLIYMTCSILEEENEAIVQRFLEENHGWKLLPYTEVWGSITENPCPHTLAKLPDCLLLTPRQHGTDGFFVSIFERNND